MNSTAWRHFAHRPGGVLLTLLLVALLAFGGHFCPTPVQAAPASAAHDCCPDSTDTPDRPAKPLPQTCHDGACLRAVDHHDVTDRHGPSANGWDKSPQSLAVTSLLPPDWASGQPPLPALVVSVTGPPPPQRSRVLRL